MLFNNSRQFRSKNCWENNGGLERFVFAKVNEMKRESVKNNIRNKSPNWYQRGELWYWFSETFNFFWVCWDDFLSFQSKDHEAKQVRQKTILSCYSHFNFSIVGHKSKAVAFMCHNVATTHRTQCNCSPHVGCREIIVPRLFEMQNCLQWHWTNTLRDKLSYSTPGFWWMLKKSWRWTIIA